MAFPSSPSRGAARVGAIVTAAVPAARKTGAKYTALVFALAPWCWRPSRWSASTRAATGTS